VPGDLTAVLTAVICAAFVTAAEPVQGLASLAIAGVLVGRIGLPPAVIRDQVLACTDIVQLDAWGMKAATAQSVEEIFGAASDAR
jgi:hypothetical protein